MGKVNKIKVGQRAFGLGTVAIVVPHKGKSPYVSPDGDGATDGSIGDQNPQDPSEQSGEPTNTVIDASRMLSFFGDGYRRGLLEVYRDEGDCMYIDSDDTMEDIRVARESYSETSVFIPNEGDGIRYLITAMPSGLFMELVRCELRWDYYK